MKNILLFFCFFTLNASIAQKPVPVIFDTDIAPDYDDVGAIALLHALEDKGEAKILATMSCNTFETTAPTLSVFNTYFKRPDIPIGVTKAKLPNEKCSQEWAQAIIQKYPHSLSSNDQAEDATVLYRKILAAQPDKSVTIITVGFFTNLANLLDSEGDKYSPLNGKDLAKKKVKQLVSMASGISKDGVSGREFNVFTDAPASKKVFREWPTPTILSGFEIGRIILTGIPLINNASIQNSPVKDAFEIALTKGKETAGHPSWDQTAVLAAVRGLEPWFKYRKLNFEIKDDGTNAIISGKKFDYIEFKQTPKEISAAIEALMMHQPK
ncbi:MAG TPA: nucleoside hydrolase [Chryseolinea sp.]|nr:nucleoside hydrolase [Chryseolinea sp.]